MAWTRFCVYVLSSHDVQEKCHSVCYTKASADVLQMVFSVTLVNNGCVELVEP